MNAWSHLTNARHIDWVIKSLKENPELWSAARGITHDSVRDMAHDSARDIAHDSARGVAWYTARDAIYSAAYSAQGWDGPMRRPGVSEAQSVILSLIAYDDCDQYLQMTYEKLKMYAILSEKPQAVLLLPMVYVMEKSNECLVTPA